MAKIPDMIEVFGFPITLVFQNDGTAYLSERLTGIIWKIDGEKFSIVKKLPILNAIGHHEAGLLGIALDPDFDDNHTLYAYYTEGETLDKAKNKIVKIKIGNDEVVTIYDEIPGGQIHNGGIIAFGPDGKLYVGVGVHNEDKEISQDPNYLGGKVLRMNSDGTIPDDNPFPGNPVYSFGHRNIFGLAFHPLTGQLFVSEAGPEENDEINIIQAGGNYGWPLVTGKTDDKRFVNPIITYTPTITPTQCCFVGNNFYFGSYNEGTVHKLTLDENDPSKVMKDEVVYKGRPFGIIGVFASPQSEMFVTTPNKVIKIN